MPNLEYDPKNPTDLIGQPLERGDLVAWGTTYGRSAALCIAEIDSFRFTMKNPGYPQHSSQEYIECEQHQADRYTLRLRPLKSTGDVTWVDAQTGKGVQTQQRYGCTLDEAVGRGLVKAKLKSVQHVKNVVKLPRNVNG